MRLSTRDFPSYFAALGTSRIIAAENACTDDRTSEFDESYLRPHGIGALLDAPIRVRGRHIGVLCHEFIGPSRTWNDRDCTLAGTLGAFVAFCIESCDRATAEQAQRDMEAQLARAQRMDGLGRLAAGISHDFNNLLTVIRGNLELMELKLQADTVDRTAVRGEIDAMETAVARATSLTQKLASVGRNNVAHVRTLDPIQSLRRLADGLRHNAPTGIKITVRCTPDTPKIEMDAAHFDRIVLELARNAVDAMREGGTLRLRTDYSADTGREGSLELVVLDSGVGIPPEALPLIFNRSTRPRRSGGVGGSGSSRCKHSRKRRAAKSLCGVKQAGAPCSVCCCPPPRIPGMQYL